MLLWFKGGCLRVDIWGLGNRPRKNCTGQEKGRAWAALPLGLEGCLGMIGNNFQGGLHFLSEKTINFCMIMSRGVAFKDCLDSGRIAVKPFFY